MFPKRSYVFTIQMVVFLFALPARSIGAEECVMWLDGAALTAETLNVDISGEYSVWIWARGSDEFGIGIGDTISNIPADRDGKDTFSWRQGNRIKLRAGKQGFSVRDKNNGHPFHSIATIVLATNPGYEPAEVAGLFRVMEDEPGRVHDRRCDESRNLNQFMEFKRFSSLEAWERRAGNLREHIRVLLGLVPEPERCPLNPRITGRVERDGYSVEKVAFESWPGFFVTGNLYRPLGRKGPFPGIISPHGHWAEGRLADSESGSVPGRCVNFARQGYVMFSYDMVGYVDSCQLDHQYGGDREAMWGLSLMAVQTWNSIRALDFIQALPDVDPGRIGVTGASGGGTQTFMLYAVDERPMVAAPVNMISGRMQGGCLCENAPLLRIEANNIEIGALFAPKPLFMVSCTGDWTDETPFNEFPSIRSIYRLYGAGDHVGTIYVDAGHNYNKESREGVYTWFAKWLKGDPDAGHVAEEPYKVEAEEDLRVFPDGREGHPFPEVDGESFTAGRVKEIQSVLDSMNCNSAYELEGFRALMGMQWRQVFGASVPEAGELEFTRVARTKRPGYQVNRLILGRKGYGDRVPAVLYLPTHTAEASPATILVHPEGKRAFVDLDSGNPAPLVMELLERGHRVLALDAFLTGEHHSPYGPTERDRSAGLFTTYNYTDTACRVQDILTAIGYLRSRVDVGPINLVGLDRSGVDVALARALYPEIDRTAVDLCGLDLSSDDVWLKNYFVPCIRKIGDIRSALILAAPGAYLIQRAEGIDRGRIHDAYNAAHRPEQLQWAEEALGGEALAEWIGG